MSALSIEVTPYTLVVMALFGAVFGSFLNVVIYRLPLEDKSVARGRSKCPGCDRQIAWYDNVPLLGWLFLRGKCRSCGWKIPARYPLVELISCAAATAIVWKFGFTLLSAWLYGFVAIMLAITFIDWAHQIIPDELSIGGTVFGWLGAWLVLPLSLTESLIGSAVGAGLILLIAVVYRVVRKIDGMGGGDVKLMAMIGAFVGWQMIFPVLFIAAFFGSVHGIALMRKDGDGQTAVAFGSFLAPAACVMLFFGPQLIDWYWRLQGR